MKRDELADVLVARESARHMGFERHTEPTGPIESDGEPETGPLAIDHVRARALILEQTQHLLPPAEANALADHLLACDRCFRFAQDVAHQERQSGKHSAIRGES